MSPREQLITWLNSDDRAYGELFTHEDAVMCIVDDLDEYSNGTRVYHVRHGNKRAKVVVLMHDTRSLWYMEDPDGIIVWRERE